MTTEQAANLITNVFCVLVPCILFLAAAAAIGNDAQPKQTESKNVNVIGDINDPKLVNQHRRDMLRMRLNDNNPISWTRENYDQLSAGLTKNDAGWDAYQRKQAEIEREVNKRYPKHK